MRPLLLALVVVTSVPAQTDGRLSVSGSAVLHGLVGAGGVGGVPAASLSGSYRLGEGDRLGAFVLVSPESQGIPQLAVVGGAWDVLIDRGGGPYVTVGLAIARQRAVDIPLCSPEDDLCFDESGVDRRGFTALAAVLGGGVRFDLGRGAFVRTDLRLLAGPELVRPLLGVGGGVRL